jgi:hypothetical protein
VVETEQDIYDRIIKAEKGTLKRLWGEEIVLSQGQLLWAQVYSRIMSLVGEWSVHKDRQFETLRAELGFTIEWIPVDEELAKSVWGSTAAPRTLK